MTWNRVRSLFVVSCIAAFVTVGCGQGSPLSTSGLPGALAGPTALTADAERDVSTAASLSDTFVALGNGNGRGKDKDKGKEEKNEDEGERPNKENRGSLSGFVTAVSATTITVRGVVVTVPAATKIRHGNRTLSMADIQVGDHVQVKGTTTTTTTGTVFTAAEIKVEDMDHDDEDDDGAKVEGKISGLTGTCPALTFNVVSGTTTTTTTKVTTNAATKFDDGLCTALANDAVVEVKGAKQTDGSILATKVERE